jgi:exonuclease SbcD
MRILHTSDWHLNDRLDRIKRQPDIAARLEEIAGYLDEHQVDVMIVSGDIFSNFERLDEVRAALEDVQRIFKPFLLRGGTIIGISGNHDSESLFNLLRAALDLASPLEPQGARPRGRLYLAAQPTYLRLEDRNGQPAQFVLMPYPTIASYLHDESARFNSADEKNRLLHQAVVSKLRQIYEQRIDPHLPSVLVAHAHIRGSAIHNLYRISERDDVVFDPGDLPANWAYIAYGHIHKPQAMHGAEHIRYAGSVDRMDFGEMNDEKSVTLIEIGDKGRIGEPTLLSLNATPLHRIEILDPETDMRGLAERYADAQRTIVEYKLVYQPGQHNREALCREIETIFPRWCRRDVVPRGEANNLKLGETGSHLRDVKGVVRSFLAENLAAHSDRDELLALAEQLLLETEASQ